MWKNCLPFSRVVVFRPDKEHEVRVTVYGKTTKEVSQKVLQARKDLRKNSESYAVLWSIKGNTDRPFKRASMGGSHGRS